MAATISIRIIGDAARLRDELRRTEGALRGLDRASRTVFRTGAQAAGIFGVALGSIGGFGLKIASELEVAELSFTQFLGSADAANKLLGELNDFARTTPFDIQGLRENTARLLALGVESQKVIPLLAVFGDASAAAGSGQDGLNRALKAYQDINAKGFVQAEEIRQLVNAGIPALAAIAAELGVSEAEALDAISKREVSAQTFEDAILNRSGDFLQRSAGLMELQAQTLSGVLENLQDTIRIKLGEAVRPALEGAKESLLSISDSLDGIFETLGPNLNTFLVEGLGVLDRLVPSIGGALAAAAEYVSTIFTALNDVIDEGTFSGITDNLAPAFDAIILAIPPLVSGFAEIAGLVSEIAGPALEGFFTGWSELAPVIGDLLVALGPVAEILGEIIGFGFEVIGDTLIAALQPLIDNIGPVLVPALEALQPALEAVLVAIGEVSGELLIALVEALVELLPPLTELLIALTPLIIIFLETLLEMVPVFELMVDGIVGLTEAATFLVEAFEDLGVPTEHLQTIFGLMLGPVAALGLAFGQTFESAQDFYDAFTDVLDSVGGTTTGLFESLAGAVDAVGEALSPIGDAATEAFDALVEGGESVIESISGVASEIGEFATEVGDFLVGIGESAQGVGEEITGGIVAAVLGVVDAFVDLNDKAEEVFGFITGLVGDFASAFSDEVGPALEPIAPLIDGISAAVSVGLAAAAAVATAAFGVLAALIVGPVVAAFGAVVGVSATMQGAIGGAITSAIGFFGNLNSSTGNTFAAMTSVAGAFASNLIARISGAVGSAIGSLTRIGTALAGIMARGISIVTSFAARVVSSFASMVGRAIGLLPRIATALGATAGRGVALVITALLRIPRFILGLAGQIFSAATSAFGGLARAARNAVSAVAGIFSKIKVPSLGGAVSRLAGGFGINVLADGGVITEATLAVVGEYAGAKTNPEIVTPSSLMREIIREELRDSVGGRGGGFNIEQLIVPEGRDTWVELATLEALYA